MIYSPPMTMQDQLGLQISILPEGNAFDMWHDYMNLGKQLLKLHGNRESETADIMGPKKEPTADGCSSTQACAMRSNLGASPVTSSTSSLSDTSTAEASADFCRFCKQNGETATVYRSHMLKLNGKVVCPVLWSYTCPTCGATGDDAHTRKYCPRADDARRLPLSGRL